ncbi:hypothetical protein A6C57_07035 [Fibrella sp. ES10-3-2-2]|nr:hypothetical protein A6C57_07035 [Fibrella sp. ES10-3-2-2]
MKKLLGSYKTLTTLITQARCSLNALAKIREESYRFRNLIQLDGYFAPVRSDWLVSDIIRNQIILTACSALDEFQKHFIPQACPELADRVGQLRRQIRPILGRIDKWDLKKYRNQMIAHNLRIEGQAIIDREGTSLSYSIPRLFDEFVLLVELLTLLIQQMAKAFPELVEQAMLTTETIRDKMTIEPMQIDWEEEYQAVLDEIENQTLDQTTTPAKESGLSK